jgi:hypothetical protein
MHEILEMLPPRATVLDLGCRDGSFPEGMYDLQVIRADLQRPESNPGSFVQADATQLPFRAGSFDAVILNHSAEHFVELKKALQEVGRVVKAGGALYVAVPDARTFSDRLYRKLYRNAGGHVNLFGSAAKLTDMLSWYSGLRPAGIKTLFTSFTYWNRTSVSSADRKCMRLPALWEPVLTLAVGATRFIDSWLGTRTSVYGWAIYLGTIGQPVATKSDRNVCVRCGQGHPADWLREEGRVRKTFGLLPSYSCPGCSAWNLYFRDRAV